jgi:hypothetical protein
MKTLIQPVIIILLVVCFVALPKADAVNPPPDGGYPGGNTAEGQNALFSLTGGSFNTAVGFLSLRSDIIGNFNTAVGAGTLLANTAYQNTAIGAGALLANTAGVNNTATGAFALINNIGSGNTANGTNALSSNTAGLGNTAIGESSLSGNTIGNFNIALGNSAGFQLTTGDNNICIGAFGTPGESGTIRIGISGIQGATHIAGISGATASGGAAVFVNTDGQLGTLTSSARFKDEIKPMDNASEAILALKPVTFRYKKEIDPKGIPQFGLVAEDVEKVNPDLVARDRNGNVNTVRYEQVNAMLLNEFLKEHRKVEKLEATVAALAETVKEQAAQLRRVSAQSELSRPAMNLADTSQ